MRRALLVPFLSTHFIELRRVAAVMKRSGRWEPVFHFPRFYPEAAANADVCKAEGWEWTSAPGATVPRDPLATGSAPAPAPLAPWRRVFRQLPSPLRKPLLSAGQYALRTRTLRRLAASARALLENVSLLVLAEDNLDYHTGAFIRAGHDAGIPTVIVPFTVANALEPAEAFFASEPHAVGSVLGRRIAKRYPHWVFTHRGRALLRLPAAEALATEHLGLAPPHPWILNSGHADAIAVESTAMLAHYRACGFPDSQLVVTGALYDDVLAEAAKNAPLIRRELGLDERPVLLCALPPDQVESRKEPCDFPTHEALCRYWISTLVASPGFQVVVSLHPRIDPRSMAFVEELGAKIARTDIARLIPMASLFVASVSATIRLAIACGVPVLNYDVYRFRYTDYEGVPGVLTLEDRSAFEAAFHSVTIEPHQLSALADAQREITSTWGCLDGKAGERMLGLFDRLGVSERRE